MQSRSCLSSLALEMRRFVVGLVSVLTTGSDGGQGRLSHQSVEFFSTCYLGRLLIPLLIALGSCHDAECPTLDAPVIALQSGTYSTYATDGYPTKRVVVDRQAGTATFTFPRDGKLVVETWMLSDSMKQ
jgi:hypothetical protein